MATVLITGCSSGIGLATAATFAEHGWTVVATMRDLSRSGPLRDALAAAGGVSDIRMLDVASDDSVHDAMQGVLADHGTPDVVVSNAGIGIPGSTEELSVDDFRRTMETNVYGSVRLLHAVMPGWRAQRAGRFLATSSVAGAIGQPFNDSYCASKFALEGMLEALHPVAAQHGIYLSLIEPGPVAGDFNAKYESSRVLAGDPYQAARTAFFTMRDGAFDLAQTNEDIAALIFEVATAERPSLRYQTSDMVQRMVGLKLKDMTGDRLTAATARWVTPT